MLTVLVFLLLVLKVRGEVGESDRQGWRMEDRFFGFRYSLGSSVRETAVVQEADRLGCFGWVQRTTSGLVGEARCRRARGEAMAEWLRAQDEEAVVRVYPDTKIRLHFSHFKVLEPDRDTCFLDPPHMCPEAEGAQSASHGTDEL